MGMNIPKVKKFEHTQISIPSGDKITWNNLDKDGNLIGTVILNHVGPNCYASTDVIFEENITLQGNDELKRGVIVHHDTTITPGCMIYGYAELFGGIVRTDVPAWATCKDGEISCKTVTAKNGTNCYLYQHHYRN